MKPMSTRELEMRHRSLDEEISRLERRGIHMTPAERLQAAELKKLRLQTKDQIYEVQKDKDSVP